MSTVTIPLSRFQDLVNKEEVLREIQSCSNLHIIQKSGIQYGHQYQKNLYTINETQAITELNDKNSILEIKLKSFESLLDQLKSRNLFQRIINRPIK